MPRNGSGEFALTGADFTNGTLADADEVMAKLDDIATALTQSLAKDGQTVPTAALPMGTFNHTNVGVATARTHYARASQIADGALTYGGVAGGTADAATIAPSPAITAYVVGQRFQYKTGAAANTGASTLNVNGVGSGAETWPDGTPLAAGDKPANSMIEVVVAATTPVFHLQTATRAPLTQTQLLALSKSFSVPGHRLTLTTATPVTASDVTAAGTVYWSPYRNNLTPIYNGTAWQNNAIAELSFIIDSTNHLPGKNYDFFLDYNSGTPRLVTGPAWTTDTARADALGLDATYGYVVNNASMTVRITNNGGSTTLAAKAGLYLGTIRCTANAQTEDSHAKRFLWNNYNRVMRAMRGATETADSWSYNSTTTRQANANTANQLDMVRGLDEDAVGASVSVKWANNTVGESGIVQIGLDSTTTMATGCIATNPQCQVTNLVMVSQAEWRGHPGIGRRFLAWLEKGTGAGGTQTWSGDGGSPTSFQSGIVGWGMA